MIHRHTLHVLNKINVSNKYNIDEVVFNMYTHKYQNIETQHFYVIV